MTTSVSNSTSLSMRTIKIFRLLVILAMVFLVCTSEAQGQQQDTQLQTVSFIYYLDRNSEARFNCDFSAPGRQPLSFSKLQQQQQSDIQLMCNSQPSGTTVNCLYGSRQNPTNCTAPRTICEDTFKGQYVRVSGSCP
ncbi:hypothetical protein BDF20DRAFT_893449 [Mycotypha africana]|uniref:uncharacterized protein n=1 Tax=Mycotypha africana TaxID=64632 RepID=UPI0023008FCC|nr:uncharacterized protein BDF20DRAFT_893449 [Mycotypha africana]KAI8969147.1 hypothetical protein BDF20DRAFT_893449 [Mycotypha africana]